MGSCEKCRHYSKTIDDLNRSFNDVGNVNNHYCMMWNDAIPDGIYDGKKDCEFWMDKEKDGEQ